jgi:hypothetical protein
MPIKVMTFEQWLLAFPEVREEVKENLSDYQCERCEGSGEITCVCPNCDGSGECTDEAVALKQLYAKQLQSDLKKAEESGLFTER